MGDPGDPAALVDSVPRPRTGWSAAGIWRAPNTTSDDVGRSAARQLFVSAAAARRYGRRAGRPAEPRAGAYPTWWRSSTSTRSPAAPPQPTGGRAWRVGAWQPSWTPARARRRRPRVREAIARGDVYQVNVVGHASAAVRRRPAAGPAPASPRCRGPATAAMLDRGAAGRSRCASPETLVRVAAGGWRPGRSRAPGRPPPAGRRELLASAKERAEHVMIVDLERNDLARVARTGSVRRAASCSRCGAGATCGRPSRGSPRPRSPTG